MRLILIPCSGKKASGGQSISLPSKLVDSLSPATYKNLLNARQEIASVLQNIPNTNLGFNEDDGERKFIPAFQRYQGLIYIHSDLHRLYPTFKGHLVIVSAMYGLLDGNDLIRNYELQMSDTLPTGTRVGTFWRRYGLRNILLEYIAGVETDEVHDLLSDNYRDALRPWPDSKIQNCREYNYPGMGQGSSFARAKDLKGLLSQ